jgi:hypothetical protein
MTRDNARRPAPHAGPVVVSLVLLLATAGCTSTNGAPSATDPATTGSTPHATASAEASPAVSALPSGTPPSAAPDPAAKPDGAAQPTKAPVPLSQPADFGTGVVAKLDKIESIVATAHGPGEISGPALAFTITVTNRSTEAVDLGSVIVNLTDAHGDPGVSMFGPPAVLLSGTLAVGASATGTYVFAVASAAASMVRLEVSYSTQAPTVVFSGDPAAG